MSQLSYAGDYRGGAPPDPISNSVVKPSSADGTAWETVWESRSSPAPFEEHASWYLLLRGVVRFGLCFYELLVWSKVVGLANG